MFLPSLRSRPKPKSLKPTTLVNSLVVQGAPRRYKTLIHFGQRWALSSLSISLGRHMGISLVFQCAEGAMSVPARGQRRPWTPGCPFAAEQSSRASSLLHDHVDAREVSVVPLLLDALNGERQLWTG